MPLVGGQSQAQLAGREQILLTVHALLDFVEAHGSAFIGDPVAQSSFEMLIQCLGNGFVCPAGNFWGDDVGVEDSLQARVTARFVKESRRSADTSSAFAAFTSAIMSLRICASWSSAWRNSDARRFFALCCPNPNPSSCQ